MRERRVGTLSMGLVLIGTGVFMIYSYVQSQAALELAVRWWPLILFLLGGEVLWQAYGPGKNTKLRYDIFSIIIIFLIVLSSLGIYGISQIGALERLRGMVTAQNFTLQTPLEEIVLDPSVKKIVVEPPQSQLTVRIGTGDQGAIYGKAYVNTDSQENAEKLVMEKTVINRKAGDTLYIGWNSFPAGNGMGAHAYLGEQTLLLPGDREIEIQGGNSLCIIVDELKSNLLVDGARVTEVRLPGSCDVETVAFVRNAGNLQGNVQWNTSAKSTPASGQKEQIKGSVLVGQGSYKINIISDDDVVVNKVL